MKNMRIEKGLRTLLKKLNDLVEKQDKSFEDCCRILNAAHNINSSAKTAFDKRAICIRRYIELTSYADKLSAYTRKYMMSDECPMPF